MQRGVGDTVIVCVCVCVRAHARVSVRTCAHVHKGETLVNIHAEGDTVADGDIND